MSLHDQTAIFRDVVSGLPLPIKLPHRADFVGIGGSGARETVLACGCLMVSEVWSRNPCSPECLLLVCRGAVPRSRCSHHFARNVRKPAPTELLFGGRRGVLPFFGPVFRSPCFAAAYCGTPRNRFPHLGCSTTQ